MAKYIPPSERNTYTSTSHKPNFRRLKSKTLADLNNEIKQNLQYNQYLNNKLFGPVCELSPPKEIPNKNNYIDNESKNNKIQCEAIPTPKEIPNKNNYIDNENKNNNIANNANDIPANPYPITTINPQKIGENNKIPCGKHNINRILSISNSHLKIVNINEAAIKIGGKSTAIAKYGSSTQSKTIPNSDDNINNKELNKNDEKVIKKRGKMSKCIPPSQKPKSSYSPSQKPKSSYPSPPKSDQYPTSDPYPQIDPKYIPPSRRSKLSSQIYSSKKYSTNGNEAFQNKGESFLPHSNDKKLIEKSKPYPKSSQKSHSKPKSPSRTKIDVSTASTPSIAITQATLASTLCIAIPQSKLATTPSIAIDENLSYQNDKILIEKFGITTNSSTVPPKTLPNDNNSNEKEILPITIRTNQSKDPNTTPHTPQIPNTTFIHEKLNGKKHINKNKSQKIDDAIMRALTHILLDILLALLLSHVYLCTDTSYSEPILTNQNETLPFNQSLSGIKPTLTPNKYILNGKNKNILTSTLLLLGVLIQYNIQINLW